jgi:alkylhydroperoxidase family enzyme
VEQDRTRVSGAGSGATSSDPFVRTRERSRDIAAHRPEVAAALEGVRSAFSATGTLSPRLVELVRIRVAFHNQCRSCMALRYRPELVDEDLVCSLERPQEAPDLTAPERAALDFADRFACDHLSIDAAMFERLREHFDDGEIVELGTRCAIFVGFGRLAASWHLVEDLPESFRVAGEVVPWGHEEVLAGAVGHTPTMSR